MTTTEPRTGLRICPLCESTCGLIFELDDQGSTTTRVRATTLAEFPGIAGRIYRALVIGTGGHRVVVRRMLRRIADAA